MKSGGGPPHSMTLRVYQRPIQLREASCALPLQRFGKYHARELLAHPSGGALMKSGGGPPHSMTLRVYQRPIQLREASWSALPLQRFGKYHARELLAHPSRRSAYEKRWRATALHDASRVSAANPITRSVLECAASAAL